MCHAGREEMIGMQRAAADIIRQSVDAEFHTIFDLSYTDSSTIDIQGTMYLKALMIKLFDLNSTSRATQYQRVEAYRPMGREQTIDISMHNNMPPSC